MWLAYDDINIKNAEKETKNQHRTEVWYELIRYRKNELFRNI